MEVNYFIKELREKGVLVKLVDDQLEVSLLNGHIDEEALEQLKANKEQVVGYLQSVSADHYQEIPKAEESVSYPVSNAQFRIWFESQYEQASIAYHIPLKIKLEGYHDKNILEEAIEYVINRHEILRTVFRLDADKQLRQCILPASELNFKLDYKDFAVTARPVHEVNEYIRERSGIAFDLENGPLLRAALLKYDDEDYYFYCTVHHIICDAWSLPVLENEILTVYNAFLNGDAPLLPGLRIQYKDYTAWSIQNLETGAFSEQKKYWLNKLSGTLPVLELPVKDTRPAVKTYNGDTLKTYFSRPVFNAVKNYQKEKEGSLYMVMLATFHIMLAKYTGNNDIIIGGPFAAREHMDLDNQIGFYTNTLALRNKLENTDSFDTFFAGVKQTILEAHNNQQYPFEEIVKELKLKKDLSRNPLFDVMLVVIPKEGAWISERSGGNGTLETIIVERNTSSKFDLLVYIQETDNDLLSLKVEYNTALFEERFIIQFINHYKKLVALLLTNPQEKLAAINYLESPVGVHGTVLDEKKYQQEPVISFFEKQVAATPDAIALQYKDVQLTYRQVNNYSNQIATTLREQYNITANVNVGVLLERSQYNVIAMLGVIKSGGCYVPIDSKYHENRVIHILEDAAIKTLLTTSAIKHSALAVDSNLVFLDQFNFREEITENPAIINTLNDASFIIYTSGSTGNPKGIIQTHRMLSNLVQWNSYDSGIPSGLRHLQYTSFSFDVSLQDTWFVLSSGGTLFITPEAMKLDFNSLSTYIVDHKVEVLCFPFSALSGFFDFTDNEAFQNHRVKHIISSGEQLVVGHSLEKFLLKNPHVQLHNHYGPSETHVVTSFTTSAGAGSIIHYVPIGKPVANTTLYLLDDNLQPVPEKVIGEIYVGGEHLANGYVKLPGLTRARFLPNPFSSNELMYKTGDLAYVDYSGNIIYLGRNDAQVKIRGYRIEPKEIEIRLLAFSALIEQVCVDAVKLNGQNVLVVYYVSAVELDKKEVMSFLGARLPDYMVPGIYMKLDNIPLTPNGKVNRKALPGIDLEHLATREYIAPSTATEVQVIKIWQEILGIQKIGIADNFFDLGGHSLNVVRMMYKIEEVFRVKMNMKDVFTLPDVQELARAIDTEVLFKGGINANNAENNTSNKNTEVWEL